jgi:hypothetical protein
VANDLATHGHTIKSVYYVVGIGKDMSVKRLMAAHRGSIGRFAVLSVSHDAEAR